MKQRIILSVINDLTTDQRVHRIAQSLTQAGWDVLLVGRKKRTSQPLTARTYKTHRMQLWFEQGKLFYLEYNIRLFFFLLRQQAHILTANDLDTLLPNYLVSRLKGLGLVYDTHEYFTEVPELINRPWVRWIWKTMERQLFPRLEHISCVNDRMASVYGEQYHKQLVPIRNLPLRIKQVPLHRERVLIYQGAVNLGRGVDLLIKAMCQLPAWQLWIAGKGDLWQDMVELAASLEVTNRVTFLGELPFETLSQYTRQARIGFSLEADLGLNYRYATPNKVFDYIQNRVPVIVSNLPEMRKLVETYQAGIVLKERSAGRIVQAVDMLDLDQHKYLELQQNTERAAQELNWETEQIKVLDLYSRAQKNPR